MPAPAPRPAVIPRAADAGRHPAEPQAPADLSIAPEPAAVTRTPALASEGGSSPLVPFSTRIPADLRKRLRLWCMEKDIEVQDWTAAAVAEKLDREQAAAN